MDPVPRCGHEMGGWRVVNCELHAGHVGDHEGRDPQGQWWAWMNEDD